METYHAYPGRVHNGQPLIADNAILPENASIIVTVISTLTTAKTAIESHEAQADRRQAHLDALEKFYKAMAEIDDEPLDGEFDAIIANGLKFRTRDLDL